MYACLRSFSPNPRCVIVGVLFSMNANIAGLSRRQGDPGLVQFPEWEHPPSSFGQAPQASTGGVAGDEKLGTDEPACDGQCCDAFASCGMGDTG